MSERTILEAVQHGHRESYSVIVEEYQTRAYQVALRLVQDSHEALDLAQDAFVRAFRKIHTFDLNQPFFPWFYRILKNLCLSHLRKRRRPRSLTTVDEDGEHRDMEIPDTTLMPSMLAERSDLAEKFCRAMQLLPPKDREILALRHYEDLSYEEISKALDIPLGTVMSRLFYARRKLKNHLEPDLV